MADSFIQVEPDGSGRKVQSFQNTVGANTVESQAASLADPASGTAISALTSAPVGTEMGLVCRLAGTSTISGSVSVSNFPATQNITGTGSAGSAASGVVTIQGIAGGTAVPISGSITATNPSVSTDGAAIPTSSTLIGASDGTNLQQLLVESATNRNLRVGLYNGANEASVSATGAVKVDGSAVTQPVSGTFFQATQPVSIAASVTVTQATAANLNATVVGSGNFTVVGAAANGAAVSGNPVLTAGYDGANSRTISTTTAGTTLVQLQNSVKATYLASVSSLANTASTDILSIEAGTTKTVRIRRIAILNPGIATTAAFRNLTLIRTTAAGSAGTLTPNPMDTTDSAYSGIVRSHATTLGTAGVTLLTIPIFTPTGATAFTPIFIDFKDIDKAPSIQPGVANGISLRDPGATGGASLSAYIEFTEE